MVTTADGIRAPEEGPIIVIVATDAPLTPDQLKRLARRVSVGLGRVGDIEGDDSGDIFLAFSTANAGAGKSTQRPFTYPNATIQRMQSWKMNAMFTSVVQATEESVINAIVAAKTMTGAEYWTVPALPHDQLQQVCANIGCCNRDRLASPRGQPEAMARIGSARITSDHNRGLDPAESPVNTS